MLVDDAEVADDDADEAAAGDAAAAADAACAASAGTFAASPEAARGDFGRSCANGLTELRFSSLLLWLMSAVEMCSQSTH